LFEPYRGTISDLAFVYAHTGRPDKDGNPIYALAAGRISPAGSTTEFNTLVRFDNYTIRERYRSNLSTAALEKAPEPAEAQKEIANFLDGVDAAFSFGFGSDLAAVRNFCGLGRIVDLDFCAAFCLQQLSSHSFKRLWEFFNGRERDRISFSAEEIVRLSVDLVKYVAGTELNDQKQPRARAVRFFLEKSDTLMGTMLLTACKQFGGYFTDLFSPCTKPDTHDWYQFLKAAPRIDVPDENSDPYRAISPETISERFQAMSRSGKKFTRRPPQIEYAHQVTHALNQNAALCVEAGTGTGKTLGYLVPVFEFLCRNPGQRVAVATYTKSLQEQIFQKEVGFTKGLFKIYSDIPVAYLKGKSSYICVEKLETRFEPGATGARLLAWLYLLINVYKFPDADLDSVSDVIKRHLNQDFFFSHTISAVSARQGCTPRHRYCPAHVVTRRAKGARLVITNHHKLALMEKDPLLKGLFRNFVIDEANHFERAVRGAFRDEISTADLSDILRYLEARSGKMAGRAPDGHAATFASVSRCIQNLRKEIDTLRTGLASINPGIDRWAERALPPGHPGFRDGDIRVHLRAIAGEALTIEASMKIVGDESVQRTLKIVPRTARKIVSELELLRVFIETVQSIAVSLDEQNSVVSYLLYKKGFALFSAPVEVDGIIRRNIYGERGAVIYTAATLCHEHRFDSFKKIVGLDRPIVIDDERSAKVNKTSRIPSHFSPDQVDLIVHRDALNGNFGNKKGWLERTAALLPGLIEENQGRTLVLFSSYHDLQYAASKTFDEISGAGYPLLVQKPGEATIGLCDEFRTVKESVLFGVDTFWYGVDFPGDTLTQVVMTRMPYPSPSDPIQSARKMMLTPKGYWERYHYENEIKVKQGIGRLIRTETDKGKVVFLDFRFQKMLDRFKQALPSGSGGSVHQEDGGPV
jgi:ATP-dependent DNA helicase DinG